MKKILLFSLAILSTQVEALVDYSEPTSDVPQDQIRPAASSVRPRITRNTPPAGARTSHRSIGRFSLGMGYQSTTVKTGDSQGKAGLMTIQGVSSLIMICLLM